MSPTPGARKAALWLTLVFVAGGGLGAILEYAVLRHGTAVAATADNEAARRARMMERLDQELHLTADQRATLEQILTGLHGEYRTIHAQIDPQINDARQKARGGIRAILTPEQKPKFEDFLKRFDEERKRKSGQ